MREPFMTSRFFAIPSMPHDCKRIRQCECMLPAPSIIGMHFVVQFRSSWHSPPMRFPKWRNNVRPSRVCAIRKANLSFFHVLPWAGLPPNLRITHCAQMGSNWRENDVPKQRSQKCHFPNRTGIFGVECVIMQGLCVNRYAVHCARDVMWEMRNVIEWIQTIIKPELILNK